NICLGERGGGIEDQFGTAHRLAHVAGDDGDLHLALASVVLECEPAAGCSEGIDGSAVAAPEAHAVAKHGEIRGGGVGAVAAAQNGDVHGFIRLPVVPADPLLQAAAGGPLRATAGRFCTL